MVEVAGRRVLLDVHDRALVGVIKLQRLVQPVRLVLPVHPRPQTLLVRGHAELSREHRLHVRNRLLLLDTEARRGLVVEKVKPAPIADLFREVAIRRNLDERVQVRLVALLALALLIEQLALQLRAQMRHNVRVRHLAVELADSRVADVDEHVRARHLWAARAVVALHLAGPQLGDRIVAPRALDRLRRRHARDAIVVKLVPTVSVLAAKGLHVHVIVAAIQAARMDEDRVQLVQVANVRVGVGGQVLAPVRVEVKELRELEARVDLRHLLRRVVKLEAEEV
mmetsp:Transcript_1122/g.3573  ORF Transcript_1122/g.3573 Transcript_1122/m.3573 type:complete len:282 (-) Transcript_1122:422-1267(-)